MVSAHRVEALHNSSASLKDLYEESGKDHDNFPKLVSEHFSRVFYTPEAFREIPTLDVQHGPDTFPDRSLVRFRAMVQDTSLSSEMYLSKSSSGKCGGWGIGFSEKEGQDMDYADVKECAVLWAVSVPGESQWCSRELDGPEELQERTSLAVDRSTSSCDPQRAHKYPHPSVPHLGVQVKLYDTDSSEQLKATDVVTFVGILTIDPLNSDMDELAEVPTLHVLYMQQHPHALLSRPYPFTTALDNERNGTDTESDQHMKSQEEVRADLISWIAEEALGGDQEAAEWILLIMIARVLSRNPPLLPPSLTLAYFPSPPPMPSTSVTPSAPIPTLSFVLGELLPLTYTLPLSLDALNNHPYVPESKEEDLHSGVLQLPKGTVLLVTESGVTEGKLVDRGVLNVAALQKVMTAQTLTYSFPFSQFTFPTDISTIVLSEGSKSAFFKTDLILPLRSIDSPLAAGRLYRSPQIVSLPSPERLAAFRNLIVGARVGDVQVNEETSRYIQREFVRERQQDQTVTSDDLIRRMTVAKLYALSLHETDLTVDIWERAKAFDERRRSACASVTAIKR
ncbi:uncharacterized protein LAESUDRAFT_729151 [Laetiporus sulphureus 93-53]|uniref:Mini-chromosome maintenance complex-binding protein n=1 Tax=Laetiporus sulphureus 93-53 TaxID=1314785 RepID=A0A165CWB8_9APHY|nr:uncharacterized protein LAESUDRAFT_729151 [Laetiporus sulphureus 93-53]KZT03570.1 hypothetical protein LAESUDRAFT_729151 [Laetiporus sulphureus 93-53]